MLVTKKICNQLSDTEIVEKSLVDIDFISCLYDRYEVKLMRYIKRMAGVSHEEAEDILQDAFIKIWRNLNDFDSNLKLSSWMYRIVHNETISVWRKKKSFGKDQKVELHENLFELASSDFEIENEPEQKDIYTHEVLELLPIKYKTVLVLKFLEGMSYEEISDVLKIPEGTVATRINRAKKAFAKFAEEKHISFFEKK